MQDEVVELVVALGEEARLFAKYFQDFVDRAFIEAVFSPDHPPVIMRSRPEPDREVKELVFQRRPDAEAFARGWAQVRGQPS